MEPLRDVPPECAAGGSQRGLTIKRVIRNRNSRAPAINARVLSDALTVADSATATYVPAGGGQVGPEVTTLTLTSVAGGAQPFMLGHAFAEGDVPSGSDIVSDTSGITLRTIVKRLWNDGSVKHAVLVGAGTFTANVAKSISLKTGPAAGGSNLTASSIQSAAPSASVQCGSIGTVNLSSLLGSAFRTWISTPEMVECEYRSAVGSDTHLVAWFYVRLWASGRVHVRTAVDNGYLQGSPSDRTYTATVIIGGSTVHNASVTHYAFTRWDVQGWIGGDPQLTPSHNAQYLSDTKLVPNYFARSPSAGTLNGLTRSYAPMQLDPHPVLGGTGGFSNHIGMVPGWDALYVTSVDARAYAAVMAASSALTTYSVVRRHTNNRAAKPTDAPTHMWDGQGTFTVENDAGTMELNHLQNTGYLAYLISGEYFHYETMALLTSTVYFALDTSDGTGTNKLYQLETRGTGETLRQLGFFCAIAPRVGVDSGDLSIVTDFQAVLASNAEDFADRTLVAGQNQLGILYHGNSLGGWETADGGTEGSLAVWMQNYVVGAFGQVSNMDPLDDMTDWNTARDWMYKWPVGLFGTVGTGNWCYTRGGSNYGISVAASNTPGNDTTAYFDSWGDAWEQSVGSENTSCAEGSALFSSGSQQSNDPAYAAVNHRWSVAVHALSYAVEHGAPGAAAAWSRLTGASNWDTYLDGSAAPDNFDDTPIWGIFPRSGFAPTYIDSMSNYQLRALSGSFTPSGAQTIEAAITALGNPYDDWLTDDPANGSPASVVSKWSGGAGDSAGHRLFVLGGGHDDSAFNGIPTFDFSGTGNTPVGWVIEPNSLSTIDDVPIGAGQSFDQYDDGKAGAVHSYDGVNYDSTGDRLYRTGGSIWSSGNFTTGQWYFNLTSKAWVNVASLPFAGEVTVTAINQSARKILYTVRGASVARFYNIAANTWSANKSLSATVTDQSYPTLTVDETRGDVILIGDNQFRLWTVNWSSETISDAAFTPTGDTGVFSSSDALTVLYDPTRDSFWIFGGAQGHYYNKITEMNASTFVCTEHALTGNTVSFNETSGNYHGSFGRAVLMDDWRAIGFCTSTGHPAYVIKLPS